MNQTFLEQIKRYRHSELIAAAILLLGISFWGFNQKTIIKPNTEPKAIRFMSADYFTSTRERKTNGKTTGWSCTMARKDGFVLHFEYTTNHSSNHKPIPVPAVEYSVSLPGNPTEEYSWLKFGADIQAKKKVAGKEAVLGSKSFDIFEKAEKFQLRATTGATPQEITDFLATLRDRIKATPAWAGW